MHAFSTKLITACVLSFLLIAGCTSSKETTSNPAQKPSRSASPSSNGIKPYSEVITDKAKTDEGLFDVHWVDDKLYYEIPDSLLNREMLLVSRIAQVPTDYFGFFSGGSKTAEQVLTFERQRDQILIRKQSYNAVASDTLPIYKSVKANNFAPILAAFPIETIGKDSASVVIEMTEFFTSDIEAISGAISFLRRQYQVRRLDGNRTYIESAKSFPKNIEVRHVLTYDAGNPPSDQGTNTLSMLMNQSMVLLPEEPMRPRYEDYRVGWFTVDQIDYGLEAQKAKEVSYIRRWRLEPKDPEAYARGELVEPVKPIVYYLDPATPKKYVPYVKQGVEDWNEAFEAAGFKNAVIAKEAPSPEEDPDWSPEDIRYSTVRWVASTIRNAVGPSVSDPRTGEIIESDIVWYHNHMRSYRNRLMIETGAANPDARKLQLDDDLIGETMRRVIAHEVGHAIGLPHNMQSSSAYPVDSLRSGTFTQEYGIATTIMEYARQNYIAQPGDENIRFIRKIGPYDKYAVNWGYRVITEAETPEDEKPILDSWIEEKAGDPVYRFASSTGWDPSSQTEDLSNDPVQASTYGLMNLKRVVPNLIEWTSTPGEGYDDLEEIYGELVFQWARYAGHVSTNIGGVYQERKASDQDGVLYTPVPADYQKEAMDFLNDHVFTTPDWLLDKEILRRIEHAGALERVKNLQARLLNDVMDAGVMLRLNEAHTFDEDAYAPLDMLEDLRRGVWSEVYSPAAIDPYRRNLQRMYIQNIEEMFENDEVGRSWNPVDVATSDIRPLLRVELNTLQADLQRAQSRIPDAVSKAHIADILERIDGILNPTD
ncbi:zinc-dependent metalloprotease [Gracilimonas sediminicola]|uniref:Zinc-dependent metalloprotease n=1 Tax=Gracilimonas sediminicola TaxID=2952158 RepID=A0A9X2L0W4_9BACT|nr:zinc-dependent metalloprotease [Gracilimonas sediminicola]MCP9290139.1 zinc-dependent metalloprotease [Gracilimonas sediminicola]